MTADLDPRDLAAEERSQLVIDAGNEEPMGIVPGLHPATALSNDAYHALTDWYSSTQLKKALPEHYKEGGSQAALDFGTLVHAVVLEPDNLGHYEPADAAKIGVKADGTPAQTPTMTAAWKRFVAEAEQDGKTVIDQADWDAAHRIRDAIATHPVASETLYGDGVSEESAFAVDENSVRHKARFDRRIPGAVIDLKTTSGRIGAKALARTIVDYGYELSAAHYLAVADLLDLDVQTFAWVFVTKGDPTRINYVEVDDAFLDRGRMLRELALSRLTNPDADAYEGATSRLLIELPPWARLTPTESTIPADFIWRPDDYS